MCQFGIQIHLANFKLKKVKTLNFIYMKHILI